jgi:hypothetical protein
MMSDLRFSGNKVIVLYSQRESDRESRVEFNVFSSI